MKKKICSILHVIAMIFSLVACGDTNNTPTSGREYEEESKAYVDFEVLYEINSDGDAEVVGFTGEVIKSQLALNARARMSFASQILPSRIALCLKASLCGQKLKKSETRRLRDVLD